MSDCRYACQLTNARRAESVTIAVTLLQPPHSTVRTETTHWGFGAQEVIRFSNEEGKCKAVFLQWAVGLTGKLMPSCMSTGRGNINILAMGKSEFGMHYRDFRRGYDAYHEAVLSAVTGSLYSA